MFRQLLAIVQRYTRSSERAKFILFLLELLGLPILLASADGRELEEGSQELQQQLDQSLEMSQQAVQAANRRVEETQERNRDLHRQLQEQVSSVVFHHTCTVCGVCRWLLLCPHTHMWQARRRLKRHLPGIHLEILYKGGEKSRGNF